MRRLPLLLLAFTLGAGALNAGTLTFEANYVTNSESFCFSLGCFSQTPGTPTFRWTFALDAAQLAVDGSYDVSASLSPSPFDTVSSPDTETHTLAANAVVLGGTVTDLDLHFHQDESLVSISKSVQFDGTSGSWNKSLAADSSSIHKGGLLLDSGTFTIEELPAASPEPGSLALLAGGLVLGLALRRRKRR